MINLRNLFVLIWFAASSASVAAADATVEFSFTSYQGPAGYILRMGDPVPAFLNGEEMTPLESLGTHEFPSVEVLRTTVDPLPEDTTAIDLSLRTATSGSNNRIGFEPAVLTNVALGDVVKVGTLVVKNGSWLGDPAGTLMRWRMTLSSADPLLNGLALQGEMNYVQNGSLSLVTGQVDPDSGADWLRFTEAPQLGSFRVFDSFEGPREEGTTGRVDVWVRLGDETLQSLRNPRSGFVSKSLVQDPQQRPELPPIALFASVLPTSRSVEVGSPATIFATLVNGGYGQAQDCEIGLLDETLPLSLTYQSTDPTTNQPVGDANTPVIIDSVGGAATFVITLLPSAPLEAADVALRFYCAGDNQALSLTGLNSVLLSATEEPSADIVALVATASNDGIVNLASDSLAGAFAVATINVGAAASVSVTADDGAAALPASLALCQTSPSSGQCINPVTPTTGSVEVDIAAGATPTFAVFPASTTSIPLDPAGRRVFVRFADEGGTVRGSTSVAIRSMSPVISAGVNTQAASGDSITLQGTPDADGLALVSQQWTQLSGPAVQIVGADTSSPSISAPAVDGCSSQLSFGYNATYSNGVTAADSVTVNVFPSSIEAFSADAGRDRTLLAARYQDPLFSHLSFNTVNLFGITELAPCNTSSVQWRQIEGDPLDVTPYALGRGIQLQTRLSEADEVLRYEFTVTATDGTTATDQVSVRLIDGREISAEFPSGNRLEILGATDTQVYMGDSAGLLQIDRATGSQRRITSSLSIMDSGRVQLLSGVADSIHYLPEQDRVLAWHGDSLLRIDPAADNTFESFFSGGIGVCCHNESRTGGNVLYTIDDNSDGTTTIFHSELLADDPGFGQPSAEVLATVNARNPLLIAIDPVTGLQTSVLAPRDTPRSGSADPHILGDKLYWEAGGALYEIDRVTNTARILSNDIGEVFQLVARNGWVYVLERRSGSETAPPFKRFRISDGLVEELPTLSGLVGLARNDNAVYLIRLTNQADESQISGVYRFDAGAGLSLLSELPVLTHAFRGVLANNQRLFIRGNSRNDFFTTELSTGATTIFNLDIDDMQLEGGHLWLHEGNQNPHRFRSGALPELPEVLARLPEGASVSEQFVTGSTLVSLYEFDSPSGSNDDEQVIHAIDLDGNNPRILYRNADAGLRDIGWHAGRIYFSCRQSCVESGTVLASVPFEGAATATIHVEVAQFPRLSHGQNRIFVSGSNVMQLFDLSLGELRDVELSGSWPVFDRGSHILLAGDSGVSRIEFREDLSVLSNQEVSPGYRVSSAHARPSELLFYSNVLRSLAD